MIDKQEFQENTDINKDVHKDFGKVPKYLEKYNQKSEELALQRAALKEKKKLPPGTRQISEEERIKTLEELMDTKKELSQLLA